MTSFITVGMSARAMPDADHRAELHLGIREKLSIEDEHRVAAFLANLACYPWTVNRALDFWHMVGTGLPIPRFPSCNAVLLHPAFVKTGLDRVNWERGEVHILHVVPITDEERARGRRSLDGLFRHWEDAELDLFVDRRST